MDEELERAKKLLESARASINEDKIHIKDLLLRCIIGVNDFERREKQDVVINITLYADLLKSSRSDRLEDTVDYKKITKEIISLVENSSFYLIEALAEAIAQICLKHPLVWKVTVSVEKPGALRFARSVGVEITRHKGDQSPDD